MSSRLAVQPADKLPLWTRLAYGTVNLPLSFVGLPLVIYLAPFYSGELGLPLGVVGTALFIGRLMDVVTDPLIGIGCDRLRTRIGRRRPWLLAGGLLMLVGVWRLFMPGDTSTVWQLLLWVSVVYVGFTMITLPHEAWGAELTGSYEERTRITATRQVFGLIGLVIATVAPAIVISQGGSSGEVLRTLGWLVIGMLPLTILLIAFVVPEPAATAEAHPPFWKGLRIMARNGPFKRILLVLLIAAIGETFRITITYFYAQSVIGVANLGTIYIWYFVTGLAAIPVWTRLANTIGKHRALAISFTIISVVSLLTFFLRRGDVLLFTVLFACKGFCFGSLQLLPSAMIADLVDVDAARSGQQRQGLFYAVTGLLLKLGMAFGQGLSLNLLQLVGFQAGAVNGEGALLWLRIFYCLVPAVLFLVTLRLVWRYPLSAERHRSMRSGLERRAARVAARAEV